MAITNNAELEAAIANWLDRQDLAARIPEFVVLFEDKVNQRLRVRQQVTTVTLVPVNGDVTLPVDYLIFKRLTWTGSPKRELEYVDNSYFVAAFPDRPSDIPRFFTIEGNTLRVVPVDATSLELVYAQKVPALATTDPNWLLTAHPSAYLFGALEMAATFTEDSAAQQKWAAKGEEILAGIFGTKFAQEGPVMIRAYGSTP